MKLAFRQSARMGNTIKAWDVVPVHAKHLRISIQCVINMENPKRTRFLANVFARFVIA